MSETVIPKSKRKSPADYERMVDHLLAEMRSLEAQMQSDRFEIERLKGETSLLREEAHRLERETQATLARLKAVFA